MTTKTKRRVIRIVWEDIRDDLTIVDRETRLEDALLEAGAYIAGEGYSLDEGDERTQREAFYDRLVMALLGETDWSYARRDRWPGK